MNRWPLFAVTLLLAAILGWWANLTPAPLPATAPAGLFAAGRAMADVRVVAARPHPGASPQNAVVRAHLVARLTALGFAVRQQPVALTGRPAERLAKWGGDPAAGLVNIVAVRGGRAPALPAVLLMAHYDSVWGSPGAADDASGTAAALEIARAIPAADQARDLIILLTDGEELGLVGARAFFGEAQPAGARGSFRKGGAFQAAASADPLVGHVGFVINMEARGGGGRAMMFETGRGNGEAAALLGAAMRDPAANSLSVAIYESLPNDTDFSPSKRRGLPGINFAFIGDAWAYHSPLATPDRLDQGALQHMGAQALDVTRALLAAPTLPARAPDWAFADVLGLFIIGYPLWAGWLVLGASAALLLLAARLRPGEWRLGGVMRCGVDGIATAALAALLLTGFNMLSGSIGSEYYDRLAALPRLEFQAALLVLAVIITACGFHRAPFDRALGLAGLGWLVALAIQAAVPGAGPVFAWPVLIASGGIAFAAARKPRLPGGPLRLPELLPAMLGAVIGLAMLGAIGHFALLGVGDGLPAVLAVLMLPGMALLALLLPPAPQGWRSAAFVLIVAAAAMALWIRLDGVAPSVPPYADTKKS
ncbi:M28 family peptidase [Sandarakinorhabdus sp.]|uniref:M28 family peptidase n=1 Tax=Sandarakinorhabdus sp. TaxID=1916663 RepID=UPI00286E484B|nr:M28 family peptidase [Sandarakinorhabdus sp.]